MKKTFLMAAFATLLFASCNKELMLNENNIDEIVAAMTPEEKAMLVVGIGMDGQDTGESATVGSSIRAQPPLLLTVS